MSVEQAAPSTCAAPTSWYRLLHVVNCAGRTGPKFSLLTASPHQWRAPDQRLGTGPDTLRPVLTFLCCRSRACPGCLLMMTKGLTVTELEAWTQTSESVIYRLDRTQVSFRLRRCCTQSVPNLRGAVLAASKHKPRRVHPAGPHPGFADRSMSSQGPTSRCNDRSPRKARMVRMLHPAGQEARLSCIGMS